MKKKNLLILIAVLLAVSGILYAVKFSPHAKAISRYKKAAKAVAADNQKLNSEIDAANALLENDKPSVNPELEETLREKMEKARESIRAIPIRPSKTEAINQMAEMLETPGDMDRVLEELKKAEDDVKESEEQFVLVDNPSQESIIEKLEKVRTITAIEAVTEGNDPNNLLNKPRSYNATIYFEDSRVSPSDVFGDGPVEKGTAGGGAVEIYDTQEDAVRRNDYLGDFDGSNLAGSHEIVGTVIIRVSDHLTGSQQKELTKEIKEALLEKN